MLLLLDIYILFTVPDKLISGSQQFSDCFTGVSLVPVDSLEMLFKTANYMTKSFEGLFLLKVNLFYSLRAFDMLFWFSILKFKSSMFFVESEIKEFCDNKVSSR